MEELKFTQEVKDNWIANLESGKYKQGFGSLITDEEDRNIIYEFEVSDEIFYCCIGVLGDCTPGLNNFFKDVCPYIFLDNTIGSKLKKDLYIINDAAPKNSARDYSNVLPLIKSLPVQG